MRSRATFACKMPLITSPNCINGNLNTMKKACTTTTRKPAGHNTKRVFEQRRVDAYVPWKQMRCRPTTVCQLPRKRRKLPPHLRQSQESDSALTSSASSVVVDDILMTGITINVAMNEANMPSSLNTKCISFCLMFRTILIKGCSQENILMIRIPPGQPTSFPRQVCSNIQRP